jgi:hypothetical protein
MRRKLVFILHFIAVPLLAVYCSGQPKGALASDGSTWHGYSKEFKVAYVAGYMTGMDYAQLDCTFECLRIGTYGGDAALKTCQEYADDFDFTVIKADQLRSGMDTFYKDFRNLQVPIYMAMRLVRDEVRGRPLEGIQKELTSWLQCHADSSKCRPSAPGTK